jgi:hypothetical protein
MGKWRMCLSWDGNLTDFTTSAVKVELCGLNVLSFQLVTGAARYYIVGCYIPPNDLTTLTHIKQAWTACPKGCLPIVLGDLNANFAALRDE